MEFKYLNLVLAGILCISVGAFAVDGSKKPKAHHPVPPTYPKKFIDSANMDLSIKPV